tara:strand:+ start:2151 stop:2702 length:552 start_codon:yes stop_codon:yes gene_type:complete
MFVHEPRKKVIETRTLVLWENPEMAYKALDLCSEIEGRVQRTSFSIEEANFRDLASNRRGNNLQGDACLADLLILAPKDTRRPPPARLKTWLKQWSTLRRRDEGGLAVLRTIGRLDEDQIPRMVRDFHQHSTPVLPEEADFHRFVQEIAKRARVDLLWGAVESELEEAMRNFSFLRSLQSMDP